MSEDNGGTHLTRDADKMRSIRSRITREASKTQESAAKKPKTAIPTTGGPTITYPPSSNQSSSTQSFASPTLKSTPTAKASTSSLKKSSSNVSATRNEADEVLGKRKLNSLLQQVAPHESLLPEVEDLLLEMVDDFIESTTTAAARLAHHRGSSVLSKEDLKLHLENNWQIHVPGFGPDTTSKLRRPPSNNHTQRLHLVRKAMSQSSSSRKQ